MNKKTKQPWPTKDVMNQIYNMKLWGGKEFDFYSGFGSHNENIIKPYLDTIINFLKSFKTPLTICDLGCGDFNIGNHLVPYTKSYIAIDIVKPLIERNKTIFKADNLEFRCLDISKDELPKADFVVLRNVLQHLSNAEIQQILKKLKAYKYIILTEHIPSKDFIPNKDIISGQGIRLKQHSGVDILKPPFNFQITETKLLTEFTLKNKKGKIVTKLFCL